MAKFALAGVDASFPEGFPRRHAEGGMIQRVIGVIQVVGEK